MLKIPGCQRTYSSMEVLIFAISYLILKNISCLTIFFKYHHPFGRMWMKTGKTKRNRNKTLRIHANEFYTGDPACFHILLSLGINTYLKNTIK